MKEGVTAFGNEQPVIALDADQIAVAKGYIKDLHFALATINEGLEGKMRLITALAKNCLAVSEFNLRDLCQVLGIETNGCAEMDERNARLREANLRIRALEAQLGAGQSPEQVQLGVKALADRLNQWWDIEGFGHISELKFGAYGLEVKFCCMLFGNFSLTGSKTPVSDRERKALWYAALAERGFILGVEPGERDPVVDDCDQNRRTLCELFRQRMPSAEVVGFHSNGRGGRVVLREVDVFIRSYADILVLPVPAEPEGD